MKRQTLKKTLQVALGLTAIASMLIGCGEGGGKSSKKSNNNYGYGAYCNTNNGYNNQYNGNVNYGYNNQYNGNVNYGYNNQYNSQNCVQGGTQQCIFNGSFYTDINGRPIPNNDPFRYGCNMQGQNGGNFQSFNGDSCQTYGPQWRLMNIRGAWVCSIPSLWMQNANYNSMRYSQSYGQYYYQLYPSSMLQSRCNGGAYAYANFGSLSIGATYGFCR